MSENTLEFVKKSEALLKPEDDAERNADNNEIRELHCAADPKSLNAQFCTLLKTWTTRKL